jgi:hypothetical protein
MRSALGILDLILDPMCARAVVYLVRPTTAVPARTGSKGMLRAVCRDPFRRTCLGSVKLPSKLSIPFPSLLSLSNNLGNLLFARRATPMARFRYGFDTVLIESKSR